MATTIGEAVSADSEAARRLGSLTTRFNAPRVGQLAGHCAVLVATGYLVTVSIGSYWLVLALLAHGFVLVFLFAP